MNLQQLKRGFDRFKRWVRQTPEFPPASEDKHQCQCCGHSYRGNYCPRCSQKAGLGRITCHPCPVRCHPCPPMIINLLACLSRDIKKGDSRSCPP